MMVTFWCIKFKLMAHIKKQKGKKLSWIILVAAVILMTTFLWYLFVKPYDYQAKMTVNSSPGFVYQAVVDCNKDLKMSRDIAINYANRNPFDEIEYEAEFSEIPLSFNWKIKENNDSTSFINIGINHKGNSVNERIHKLCRVFACTFTT